MNHTNKHIWTYFRVVTITQRKISHISIISILHDSKIPEKYRSSRSQIFLKIGVLKNFANFTEKHLCSSLFLIKLQALRRESNTCFPVKFARFLRAPFFRENLLWLLLNVASVGLRAKYNGFCRRNDYKCHPNHNKRIPWK